jgi:hypothetical protein
MSRTLFALCLYTGSLPALVQDPPPRAAELDDAAAQRRFAALPVDRQELIVRTVQRRLQRDPDPLVQAVMVLDYGFADLPVSHALSRIIRDSPHRGDVFAEPRCRANSSP